MEPVRLRLGELLVDARIITQEQLEEVLAIQKQDGRRLGTLLVERELVNETQLTQILSQQLSVPWVSLYHVDFSKRLLGMVPRAVAEKYCLVPIYARHVRGQGDTLYVAMDDPTNVEALRECASWSGLPTRAMIASPSDIRNAIDVYYVLVSEGAPRSVPPEEPPPSSKAPEPAPATLDSQDRAAAAPDERASAPSTAAIEPEASEAIAAEQTIEPAQAQAPEPDSAPEPQLPAAEAPAAQAAAQQHEVPPSQPAKPREDDVSVEVGEELSLEELLARRRSRKPTADEARRARFARLMSLTLLDGTTLTLPSGEGEAPAAPKVTAGDIVASLRAAARGDGAATALGPNARWESIAAVVISLLLRKGLITEAELVEEFESLQQR